MTHHVSSLGGTDVVHAKYVIFSLPEEGYKRLTRHPPISLTTCIIGVAFNSL